MIRSFSMALALSVALPVFAQPSAIEPPIAGRPVDFSNIVGKYRIEVSAEPREVFVEEPITLQVRIKGEGPTKYEPQRKHLQIFPNWDEEFYVENVPAEDRVLKAEKTWLFVYRLRPKHVKVTALDDIKLSYYNPEARRYESHYAARIEDLVVKSKPAGSDVVATPIAAPDSFYRIDDTGAVLASAYAPSSFPLAPLLAGAPFVCVLGAMIWRRLRPDEARRLAAQRSQAARQACAQLERDSAFPWNAVQQYLCERLDFTIDDPTPSDVAAFLKRRGFTKEHCAQAAAFFQSCDAARYTRRTTPAMGLHAEGVRLIQALEADPCVH